MARSLRKSNAHFQKAITRLPLGRLARTSVTGVRTRPSTPASPKARASATSTATNTSTTGWPTAPASSAMPDPRVDEAARAGIEVGGVFALGTEREYAVAERISQHGAGSRSWCASRTPAPRRSWPHCASRRALHRPGLVRRHRRRLSTAYSTPRCGTTPIEDWRPSAGDPHLVPYSAGVPGILRALLHAVPMNDADRLESVFKAYGDQIAAFLIEPIMGNCCSIAATREYLHAARALRDRYGILLIIDEVKTGFRVARGGCQELFGVRSDLCTFAKAMANGLPDLRAGWAREDIMRRLGKGVVHGGTFTAIPSRSPPRRSVCKSLPRRLRCRPSQSTARACAPASARFCRSGASGTRSAGTRR